MFGEPGTAFSNAFSQTFGALQRAAYQQQEVEFQRQDQNMKFIAGLKDLFANGDPDTVQAVLPGFMKLAGQDQNDPQTKLLVKTMADSETTLGQSVRSMLSDMDPAMAKDIPPQMLVQMAHNPQALTSFMTNMTQRAQLKASQNASMAAFGTANPPATDQSAPAATPGADASNPDSTAGTPPPSGSSLTTLPKQPSPAAMQVQASTTAFKQQAQAKIDAFRRAALIAAPVNPQQAQLYESMAQKYEDQFWVDVPKEEQTKMGVAPGGVIQRNIITGKLQSVQQAPSSSNATVYGAQGAEAEGVGKANAAPYAAAVEGEQAALKTTKPLVAAGLAAIQSGAPAGSAAEERLGLARVLQTFGMPEIAKTVAGNVAGGELAESTYAQMAAGFVKGVGGRITGGAKELVSESAPELFKSRLGQKTLLDIANWQADNDIAVGKIYRDHSGNTGPSGGPLLPSQKDSSGRSAVDKANTYLEAHSQLPAAITNELNVATDSAAGLTTPIEKMDIGQLMAAQQKVQAAAKAGQSLPYNSFQLQRMDAQWHKLNDRPANQ